MRIKTSIITGILFIAALFLWLILFSILAEAQTEGDITLASGQSLSIACEGDELLISPIGERAVSVRCTGGVTPTVMPTATPTNTPSPIIPPYPDAPLCDEHDDTAFHTLWNEIEGCHYDHEHGMPYPEWAYDLFGNYTQYTGQEVAYVWQTPGENTVKHPGYNWGGQQFNECKIDFADGGVKSAWVQAHGMANYMGQQARVHSFWMMAELCNEEGFAGLVMSGGHADFGQLHVPAYKTNVAGTDIYPKAPQPPYNINQPPYVGLAETARHFETWNSLTSRFSRPSVAEHEIMGFAFRIFDSYSGLTLDGDVVNFGGNSSHRQFYEFSVNVPVSLVDENGVVNYEGWTDVHGNIDESCTETTAECVPLIITDALPGSYHTNGTSLIGIRSGFEGDIYFGGEESGWIGDMN